MISTDPEPATAVNLTPDEISLLTLALGAYLAVITAQPLGQLAIAYFHSLEDPRVFERVKRKLGRALAADTRRRRATGEAASSTAEPA